MDFIGDAAVVAHNASFDCSFIEKNCKDLDLPFNATILDTVQICRFLYPELTEERRKELAKDIKKKGENAKVAIRNIRRDAIDAIKKKGKEDSISEDEIKGYEDDVQKSTDAYVKKIDDAIDAKSKEIMTV